MADVDCGESGCIVDGFENEACLPIELPPGDPVFSGFKECLMFVRSQEVLKDDCMLGKLKAERKRNVINT